MARLRFGSRNITLPGSRLARIVIGVLLILCGIVGFLPVLGFWMIPLGILVLSIDLPWVRRRRREYSVRWIRWLKTNYPGLWRRLQSSVE
jgi:purine-cytosine permease-like protein